MAINFYFEQKIKLRNKKKLKLFLGSMFKEESKELASLSYIFCNDEYLLSINRQFLKHDYYTDIISFDLSEKKKDPTVGEIYISTNRVVENAENHGVSFEQELHRVIFHGALHLCGYKDKTKAQIFVMRKKENFYLSEYRLV